MNIKDIMHSPTRVRSNTPIEEATKLMDQKGIGSVLVEENGNIIGMMTERDILKKVVAAGRKCGETIVKDIMNSPLITLDINAGIEEASNLMAVHHIRRLVITEKDEIVGIVTARDLAKMLRYSLGRSIKDLDFTHHKPDYNRE